MIMLAAVPRRDMEHLKASRKKFWWCGQAPMARLVALPLRKLEHLKVSRRKFWLCALASTTKMHAPPLRDLEHLKNLSVDTLALRSAFEDQTAPSAAERL